MWKTEIIFNKFLLLHFFLVKLAISTGNEQMNKQAFDFFTLTQLKKDQIKEVEIKKKEINSATC